MVTQLEKFQLLQRRTSRPLFENAPRQMRMCSTKCSSTSRRPKRGRRQPIEKKKTKAKHFTIIPGMEVLKKNERKCGRPGMAMLPDWPNKYRVIEVEDNLVQLETMEGKPLTSKTPYASVKPLLKRSQTDRGADCSELVEDTLKVTCSRTPNDTSSKTEQDTLEEDGIVITGVQSGRTLPAVLSRRVEDFRAMLLSPHSWLDD
ncbi:uncharacterized protein LOC125310330 [Alosa alosa]|uniref:uncharacterized protein LOC125310330 n=1 Tax=Alosa alosa TaxID=278164 RepID=UPI00201516F9|nr:uncharacterized protein LOC125310330 [Alosa alosa]